MRCASSRTLPGPAVETDLETLKINRYNRALHSIAPLPCRNHDALRQVATKNNGPRPLLASLGEALIRVVCSKDQEESNGSALERHWKRVEPWQEVSGHEPEEQS